MIPTTSRKLNSFIQCVPLDFGLSVQDFPKLSKAVSHSPKMLDSLDSWTNWTLWTVGLIELFGQLDYLDSWTNWTVGLLTSWTLGLAFFQRKGPCPFLQFKT